MSSFLSRLLISCFFCISSHSLLAHCALDYPQGGESFIAGNIVFIEWSIVIPHDTENWDLYISYDAGENWNPLILNLPVDQFTFMWDVPYIASEQVKIRVVMDNIMDIDYTDESDNFTIVVPPQEGPEFLTQAQDITIECNESTQSMLDLWLEEHGGAMAIGSCGELTWTNNFIELNDSCGATGSALVTFFVSDDCGINTTTARVTVIDQTVPVIGSPALDVITLCDDGSTLDLNAWLDNRGGAIAVDACGSILWTIDTPGFIYNCGSAGFQEATFIASDDCGNTSTTSARFTIMDTLAPIIDIPAQDVVFECDGFGNTAEVAAWTSNHGGASATDACSGLSWGTNMIFSHHCGNTGIGSVTFIASDACGNTSTTQAHMTIRDSTPPVLLVAARDTIIDCAGDPALQVQTWLNQHGTALADDACGAFTWSHDLTAIPDTCDVSFSRTVHFTATDTCGNTTVTEAVVTLAEATGTSFLDKEKINVEVYPNPADQEITIAFESIDPVTAILSLSDVLGRMVWSLSGSMTLVSVPVQDFAPGIYVLHGNVNERMFTRHVFIR